MRVNFTDVQSTNYEALPKGWYSVKVTDGELRESGPNSKNPGSEYINWELTIQEGEFADRKVWTNTSLLPQALFALKGLMEAAGIDASSEIDFEIDHLIGKDVQVRLSQRTYEGEVQNDVKGFKKAGESVGASNLP